MDAMQNDERESVIRSTIKASEDYRRLNRYAPDHQMLVVLPDWVDAKLTGQDREDLLVKHHITARSHTEVYGEGETP
jgi:hypothetical protein